MVGPDQWSWTDAKSVSSPSLNTDTSTGDPVGPPFELIVTSDTVYIPQLAQPLLRTIHALASQSSARGKSPLILVCFERRDPLLIDRTLDNARQIWGFKPERIPHKKLIQAMDKAGLKWDREDWNGVELWKLKLAKTLEGAAGETVS